MLTVWQKQYPKIFQRHQSSLQLLGPNQLLKLKQILSFLTTKKLLDANIIKVILQEEHYDSALFIPLCQHLDKYHLLNKSSIITCLKHDNFDELYQQIDTLSSEAEPSKDCIMLLMRVDEPETYADAYLYLIDNGFSDADATAYLKRTKDTSGFKIASKLFDIANVKLSPQKLTLFDSLAGLFSLPVIQAVYASRLDTSSWYSTKDDPLDKFTARELLTKVTTTPNFATQVAMTYDYFLKMKTTPCSQRYFWHSSLEEVADDILDSHWQALINRVKTAHAFRWTYDYLEHLRHLAKQIVQLELKLNADSMNSNTSMRDATTIDSSVIKIQIKKLKEQFINKANISFPVFAFVCEVAHVVTENDHYSTASFAQLKNRVINAMIQHVSNRPDCLAPMKQTPGYRELMQSILRGHRETFFHQRQRPSKKPQAQTTTVDMQLSPP